jgi:hypothetical protein
VPDAAHHERSVRNQVESPIPFGRIRGGDRVLQARGELTGTVLRGGQLDQQLRALGSGHVRALRRGQRGGQVPDRVLERERRRRGGRRRRGPAGRPPQGGLVRCRPQQVRRDLATPFRGVPGQGLKRLGRGGVQRDPLVLAETRVDAVADQGVRKRPGAGTVRRPRDQPAGLGGGQRDGRVLARPGHRSGQPGVEIRAQDARRGQQGASAVVQVA